MRVRSPDGKVWRVGRRWIPWRRRVTSWTLDAPTLDLTGVDAFGTGLGALVLGLVLAVVLAVLFPVLIALALAATELLLPLLLLPLAVLARVFLSRAWVVQVRRGWRLVHDESAGDFRESGRRIEHIAREIAAGGPVSPPAPG